VVPRAWAPGVRAATARAVESVAGLCGLRLGARVHQPGERHDEQRREEEAEQDVDPGQADVVRAHSHTGDEGTERATERLFHGIRSERSGVKAASCPSRFTRHGEYVSEMPSQSEALAAVRRAVAQMPAGRWLLAVS